MFIENIKKTFRALSKLEKFLSFLLLSIFLLAISFCAKNFYLSNSHLVPKEGGTFVEGSLKQPLILNPLLAFTNTTDMDLANLIFSSLLKYNPDGTIHLDLAQKIEPGEDGKSVTFFLKQDVLWHDNEKFTADDVIFTIDLIKNAEIKTPLYLQFQKANIEKIDDYTIKISLNEPYLNFLPNCTFGILPKHIWQDVPAERITITEYNFNPIGTGPFKFKNLQKDKNGNISQINLKRNEKYFGQAPFVENFNFIFFSDQEALKQAYEENSISAVLLENQAAFNDLAVKEDLEDYRMKLFQSSALFLNFKDHPILKEQKVRQALEYAINKEKIVETIAPNTAEKIDLPSFFGINNPNIEQREYNPVKALEILQDLGWTKNEEGILIKKDKKGTQTFKLKLFTSDWDDYVKTAQLIQEDLKNIGAELEIETMKASQLKQEIIMPRKFEMVLFGESAGYNPEPFIFWHSSQKKDPGLNISGFENTEADQLLDSIQNSNNLTEKQEKTKEFLKILYDQAPAIFLYRPVYIYRVNKNVQGINLDKLISPADRFNSVEDWYLKTRRVWGK